MFWSSKGARDITELAGRFLVVEKKRNPDWVWKLKAVVRPNAKGGKIFDVRVFSDAATAGIKIKDYDSLDNHPELILYEGWFDKATNRAELQEGAGFKAPQEQQVKIFTEAEIREQVEALSQPGGTVFFYLAGSPSSGGPLGRGCAVVELNPAFPGPKQNKYILYTDDVDGMQPAGHRQKFFASDKIKEVSSWVAERHYKPTGY